MGDDRLVSVIIPALDEEANVSAGVKSALDRDRAEVIVADGGSRDGTAREAEMAGARVIHAPAGRARQMNAGAREAHGDIFLFLHADTRLPFGYVRMVTEALDRPGVAAGAFRLGIDARGPGFRLVETGANLRSRLFSAPYGDQAIFVRRELFELAGGFPEVPILEDLALVRALKRFGRIVQAPGEAVTSARRWDEMGIVRVTLMNQIILAAYLLGAPPGRLAAWYLKTGRALNKRRENGPIRAAECSHARGGAPDAVL